MFYTNDIKIKIAKYIKWIRINDNKSIREVCNYNRMNYRTYKDLEEGIIKKNDEYYDRLLNYYSISFCDDYDLFNECMEIIPQLYKCVEFNDDIKILEIIKKIKFEFTL